jgi:TolA-binding protein
VFCGTILAALLAFFGVLFSQAAPRQKNLNDAMGTMLTDLQHDRKFWVARCSELEKQIKQNEGDIRNLRQFSQSLVRLLRANGVDVLHLIGPADKLKIDIGDYTSEREETKP